jgi:hypothetical protein
MNLVSKKQVLHLDFFLLNYILLIRNLVNHPQPLLIKEGSSPPLLIKEGSSPNPSLSRSRRGVPPSF